MQTGKSSTPGEVTSTRTVSRQRIFTSVKCVCFSACFFSTLMFKVDEF